MGSGTVSVGSGSSSDSLAGPVLVHAGGSRVEGAAVPVSVRAGANVAPGGCWWCVGGWCWCHWWERCCCWRGWGVGPRGWCLPAGWVISVWIRWWCLPAGLSIGDSVLGVSGSVGLSSGASSQASGDVVVETGSSERVLASGSVVVRSGKAISSGRTVLLRPLGPPLLALARVSP